MLSNRNPSGNRPGSLETRDVGIGRSILEDLMTAHQVADLLQMRQSTIESYARRGLLPSVKVGRHRRFLRSRLEQALHEMSEGT